MHAWHIVVILLGYYTTNYCSKYGVKISHEKTKLLRITKKEHTELEFYNPINIDGHQIDFSEEAEHVGVIRSSPHHEQN